MAIDIRRVTRLAIGINTENGVEQYEFDMWPWIEEHPELSTFQINVAPPGGGTPYIATTHMEGFLLVWTIAEHDTANTGDDGWYEIEAVGGGKHKLATPRPLIVYERMGGTLGDAPDPMESWITQAAEIRDETNQAAIRAEDAADRAENAAGNGGGVSGGGTAGKDGGYYQPYVSTSGYLTWTPSQSGMPAVAGVNIKGAKGDTGAQGPQGEKGDKGDTGSAGKTPVRGTDYWTAEDIATIKEYVDDAILNGKW